MSGGRAGSGTTEVGYRLHPDARYRMPVAFGPAPGPRQPPIAAEESERWRNIAFRVAVDSEAAVALLPQRCELRDPVLSARFAYGAGCAWLAGRGYHLLAVTLPVVYAARSGTVVGDLQLVLWEDTVDPILSGRDELGFNTVFADVPPPLWDGASVRCTAAWDRTCFAVGEATLAQATPSPTETWAGDGILSVRHLPRLGGLGAAITEVSFVPSDPAASHVTDKRVGTGRFGFREVSPSSMPTQHHIVNRLAALCVDAPAEVVLLDEVGGSTLAGVRAIE